MRQYFRFLFGVLDTVLLYFGGATRLGRGSVIHRRLGRGGGGGGQGERGRVLPKRLKSGSGHHRLEACGLSNGRYKIV